MFASQSQTDCSNVRCTNRRSLWLNLLKHLLRHFIIALQRCKPTGLTAARHAITASNMIDAGPRRYSETLNVVTQHCAGSRLGRRASCRLMLMHVVDQTWTRDCIRGPFARSCHLRKVKYDLKLVFISRERRFSIVLSQHSSSVTCTFTARYPMSDLSGYYWYRANPMSNRPSFAV